MPKKKYPPEFKAKLALAALGGKKTVIELSEEFGVPQALISKWVKQLKETATDLFLAEPETEVPTKGKGQENCLLKSQLTKKERAFLLKVFEKR